MFHLNNVCAAGKVALAHEALGTMFAACLHYQVDLLGGDANMAMYRATGRKQESVDIRGSMYVPIPLGLLPRGVGQSSTKSISVLPQSTARFRKQPVLIGAHSLVWIQWWPQFSNGAIAWMMNSGQ